MKRLPFRVLALIAIVACGATLTRAQSPEDDLGNWLIYNGTVRFTDKWSLFTEAQVRLYEPASNLNEAFARFAGLYNLSPKAHVGLGYLRGATYEFVGNDRETTEDRIYGQFDIRHGWNRSIFEHRYRYEWRSVESSGTTGESNRMRYRLQVTTPLNRESMEPGANFINAYDEVFIHTRKPREFDQNRLYVAYGRQFTKMSNLQLGLLWQARTSEDFYRLQIFYTHNFDLRD